MLNTNHLMQALESAGADHNVVYLSVPITSGRREFALMKELGTTSSDVLRTNHRKRWLREVVELNSEDARRYATDLREATSGAGEIVVDPSRMQVAGWEQDDYNAFWVELMGLHVVRLVAAPDWAFSRGARGEIAYAIALGIDVSDLQGRVIDEGDLQRLAEAARAELASNGWPAADVDDRLPSLESLRKPELRPSAQSEVFYWLGAERKRQVEMFGPQADDARTREEGLELGGWWDRQLSRYWEKARSEGLSDDQGRLLLARYVATACALLESAVRVYGRLPPPGEAQDGDG